MSKKLSKIVIIIILILMSSTILFWFHHNISKNWNNFAYGERGQHHEYKGIYLDSNLQFGESFGSAKYSVYGVNLIGNYGYDQYYWILSYEVLLLLGIILLNYYSFQIKPLYHEYIVGGLGIGIIYLFLGIFVRPFTNIFNLVVYTIWEGNNGVAHYLSLYLKGIDTFFEYILAFISIFMIQLLLFLICFYIYHYTKKIYKKLFLS